jgi:hypothetical protein
MHYHSQQLLFDPSQYEKRKTVLQEKFEHENFDFLLTVKDYIFESLEDVHTKILVHFKYGEMDCRLPSVSMVSFIRKRIINNFPFYCRNAILGRFKLTTPSNDYIYIKKLDDNRLPSNVETEANNMIIFNVTKNSDDEGCNIFTGYTCPDDYSKIDGIFAVCIEGKKVIWETDLLNFGNQGAILDINPQDGTPKLKDGIVQLKKTDQKE